MTDKITKELNKFSVKEKETVKELLIQIKARDFVGLNRQKLKGQKSIYRLKKGRIRIIYSDGGKSIKILAIERRDDKTYKNF